MDLVPTPSGTGSPPASCALSLAPENAFSSRGQPGLCVCREENPTGSYSSEQPRSKNKQDSESESQGEQMENLNSVFILGAAPPPPRALITYPEEV